MQSRSGRRHRVGRLYFLLILISPLSFGQNGQDLSTLTMEELLDVKVTSASLHEQSRRDAPASVTVITADEIRRFGYRTLAEALSYVRGFFFTNDHTYNYLGIRGFSLPGDYDNRLIVMIDGHNIADNILDEAPWYGNDFPLDLNVVDRIEVVRGASAALYGSSGMLATINVITRRPANSSGTDVRIETDSLGERKAEADMAFALPRGANLLFSTAVFNNAGAHDLYFGEFDSPLTNSGHAIDMDGEKGFHTFLDLTWGNWELLGAEGDRVKQQPISWAPTSAFNDPGTRAEDSRGFVDLSYHKALGGGRQLSWDGSYDSYRYRGIYHYRYDDQGVVGDNREHDYGDWLGSRITYQSPGLWGGQFTTGFELRFDLRTQIRVFDLAPAPRQFLDSDRPDRYVGVFAQHEWSLGKQWDVNVGARFDASWLRPNAVSPRASVIYKPTSKSSVKLLLGRGFKNPNSYEMFYDDAGMSQVANPRLQPEYINSYEIDLDREFGKRFRAEAVVYHYGVSRLIQQIYLPDDLTEYVNQGAVNASGVSFQLDMRLPSNIDLSASLEFQRAVFQDRRVLPNSPGQVGKVRASMPFWRNRLSAGVGIQALGQRTTSAGLTVPWYILPEVVISSRPFAGGFQLSGGVKNLSNTFYRDPVGLSPQVDTIIGTGRAFYLNLTWHGLDPHRRAAQADRRGPSAAW